MNRNDCIALAKETVAICKQGYYTTPSGRRVDIEDHVARAVAGTILYTPEGAPRANSAAGRHSTKIEVTNETTFSALRRMAQQRKIALGCLNFASARNPGGGFLSGAQAQEESLARASALYSCLLAAPAYYERNRAHRSTLYLDLLIFSPDVPFFRGDDGHLLEEPVLASVITAPAPNCGAVMANEPASASLVNPTLRRRTELVLAVAATHSVKHFVLGAWGCGVFRNDPLFVARCFADLLTRGGKFEGCFESVIFAVYDRTASLETYRAFANVFATKPPTKERKY